MPGVIEEIFEEYVPHGEVSKCISVLEDGLRSVKETPYHAILGRDFLHHRDEAAEVLANFYTEHSRKKPLGAMYFEMNGFAINPGRWYFHGFGYKKSGDLWDLTWDPAWRAPWDYETSAFTLTDMKDVQRAFRTLYAKKKQPLGVWIAGEICEFLVVARFNQLIAAAHQVAKKTCKDLDGVPILSTAHDWDCLCPSE